MNKNDVETNPLPSYIYIGGLHACLMRSNLFILFLHQWLRIIHTYLGQAITCEYYEETGHICIECLKKYVLRTSKKWFFSFVATIEKIT